MGYSSGAWNEFIPFIGPPAFPSWLLSAWACLLVLSGRYDQLYTYVIFASAILYGMATASVIVLRFRRPDMPRPYRTIGYPVVPIAFVLGIACLIASTLRSSPRESHPWPAADFSRPAVLFLLEKAPFRVDSRLPSHIRPARPSTELCSDGAICSVYRTRSLKIGSECGTKFIADQ